MNRFISTVIFLLTFFELSAGNLPLEMRQELSGGPTVNARDRRRRFTGISSKKSNIKFEYFLKSLALPGWGEYKLGAKGEAYAFFTAEALLISSAVGLSYFSGVRTADYQNYAVEHAGVDKSGKQENYWITLGNYDNTAAYNEQKNLDRNYPARYDEPNEQWQWDNSLSRKKYDGIRIEAENLKTLSYYAIGAILTNHLLSAMNASLISGQLNLEVAPDAEAGNQPEGKLTLSLPLP